MKFSPLFQKIKGDNLIFWGVIFLIVLFIALLMLDGYIFYSSVIGKREIAVISEPPASSLSPKELDEVINLLDERQKKFEKILEGK